jgi:hypothetical protein
MDWELAIAIAEFGVRMRSVGNPKSRIVRGLSNENAPALESRY